MPGGGILGDVTDLLPVPEEPRRGRPAVTVRMLGGDDWSRRREIRLRALQDSPSAFGSTYAGSWPTRRPTGGTGSRTSPR